MSLCGKFLFVCVIFGFSYTALVCGQSLKKGNREFLVEVLMLSLLYYRKIWMFFALFMKLTLMMFLIEISLIS
jgi:hypothetical protein